MSDTTYDLLQHFEPISLDELIEYKLLNRVDTKYICHKSQLPQILSAITGHFRIQTSGKERQFTYESLYFDTPDLKTYFDHHQGKRIRYKIRFRKYVNTGDVFLEVKKKKNYNRTDKKRKEFNFDTNLNGLHLDFLNKYIDIPASGLQPAIWTNFNRITMAGKNHFERITIDTHIQFKKNDQTILLPDLVIIESKKEKAQVGSPLSGVLHDLKIKPYGFSKYILGSIVLNPTIKHNRFIRKITTINQICYGTKYDKRIY
jgi:hypothetical protein